MLPFKKILCPTDFSQPSHQGIETANELAVHFSAELLLVHVIAPVPVLVPPSGIPPSYDVPGYQKELELSAAENLEKLIQEKIDDQVRVTPLIKEGNPASLIVTIAETSKVELIVIATHGETGWRRFIFGSVAERVVRLAECPVLTVQPPHGEEEG
jgi:nucleotide-binding universal stress UspA family protein